jgi:hypothetical protein
MCDGPGRVFREIIRLMVTLGCRWKVECNPWEAHIRISTYTFPYMFILLIRFLICLWLQVHAGQACIKGRIWGWVTLSCCRPGFVLMGSAMHTCGVCTGAR